MFALPAILNQGSLRVFIVSYVSYCPQNVSLLRENRPVDGTSSYCPQNVSLLRENRPVDGTSSYCPQDKLKLPIISSTEPTSPTYPVISVGQYWQDTANSNVLKYWNGSTWVLV